MNKKTKGAFKGHKMIKRLESELDEFKPSGSPIPIGEDEMLSMMVHESASGIDISKRYPAFYKSILNNPDLREAFLDALESFEKSKKNELVALPEKREPNLEFLKKLSPRSKVTSLGKNKWRFIWQQTIEQLQSTFSPPQLAYRSDPSLFEDRWFTLLRDQFESDGGMFTAVLECSVSQDSNDSLSCALNIAAKENFILDRKQTELQATLQWGKYNQSLQIKKSGRYRFPDIPFDLVFDKTRQQILSSLTLTIDTSL